jgi:hypothetical protein
LALLSLFIEVSGQARPCLTCCIYYKNKLPQSSDGGQHFKRVSLAAHLQPGNFHSFQEKAMRFMIIVKATAESEAATQPAPDDALLAEMTDYHEQLVKAGALLDASGLKPSAQGWRIRYDGEQRSAIDGP